MFPFSVTLLVLLLFFCLVRASTIPWWNIKLAQQQGPNACVVEEISGTKHRIWTECKYWNSREICNNKPLLRYECCEGFKHIPGIQGCTGVKPLLNILDTARDLGAGKFIKYLEKSGLAQELTNEGPFTLFAPTDEVFKDLPRDQKSRLENGNTDQLRPILEYHIAEGRITSAQFKADLLVPTKYAGHKLRINKYSSRVETVNCALLQRKDQEATNGVVHIISNLLEPSFTVGRDLAELIVQDGRFQEFSKAMDRSGFMTKLRDTEQSFTVLAPSDEAFTNIRPSRLSRILNDKIAIKELLDSHILPHVMCLPAVIGEHKVRTQGVNKVTFDCDREGVKIQDTYLQTDNTMGSNGVIYLINEVLVPDRAKSLIQILEEEKLTSFLQLVKFAGLEDVFENYGEYTIFVPSEAAIFSLQHDTLKSLKNNKEKAREFVLFHSIQGRLKSEKMTNNQVLMSLHEQRPLRLHLYRGGTKTNVGPRIITAVEGATLQKADHDCINGVIHVINKALFPVNTNATQLLYNRGDSINGSYRIFLNAMEKVMSDEPELMDVTKPKTFFVPNDEAFQKIGEARFQRLKSDPSYRAKFIKNHLCKTMVISESIQPDLQYSFPSYSSPLIVTQEDGKIKVNEATATELDILTSNGIVHLIDTVLLPENSNEI